MNRQSEDFCGVREATLCDAEVVVDVWHPAFIQTHGMYSTKGEPQCLL